MIIFDLDGTLYEDATLYDRYTEHLARFLPASKRQRLWDEWTAAKRGNSVVRIGLGYDDERNQLFRYAHGRITAYIDWDGMEQPIAPSGVEDPADRDLFGPGRLNIGDWWGIPQALAARYGVGREDRTAAFHATRDFMGTQAWQIRPEPGLHEILDRLRAAGNYLIAMTNSPEATTTDVLARLGLRATFHTVIASAEKPYGLARFLTSVDAPERVLSIGDNFVNDIEPVLQVGGAGLYTDRHATGLGAGYERCYRVRSIGEVQDWLREHILTSSACQS